MIAFNISPDKDDLPDPFQDFLFSRDAWEGLQAEDLPHWNTYGSGVLELTMLNALEEKWQSYFTTSINEWNNGDPDVIDVTVQKVDPNSNCEFVRGQYTICNGDYGDTSFDGVNEVLVQNGRITASVAKMNDYYLEQASEARKQYTMCHEIGHGFGLPHSDENFYNLNLGNCMDYTDRPWSNTSPDKQTFELLQDIYGIPDMGPSDAQLAAAAQQQEGGGDETVIRSESKQSRTPLLRSSRDDEIPSAIAQRAIEAAHHLETNFADPEDDATSTTDLTWTRSRSRSGVQVQQQRNDKFASFQIDLGEGYSLQAHFLIHKPELPSS